MRRHHRPLPVVVIVGRPNVGKSTLFNRIIGEQAAIVEDRPGVTRDRKELEAEWLGVPFRVIDTGGWMPGGSDLEAKVSRQVEAAVARPTSCCSSSTRPVGMTDDDEAIADWLRRGGHDVIVVANKADNDRREDERWEFLALGLGEPYPVSALHGRRAGDLLDVVVERFPRRPPATTSRRRRRRAVRRRAPWTPRRARRPRVAIVGRPNVGKSTLFNRLVGEDRSVVHDLPARPATPSTRSSRPRTVRSCSSTRPACGGGRGSTTRPSTTRSCGRCGRSTTPTSPCS